VATPVRAVMGNAAPQPQAVDDDFIIHDESCEWF
jgi:hypothetical protein